MARKIPTRINTMTGEIKNSKKIPGDTAATVIDLTGRTTTYPRPCVYINATSASFMTVDMPIDGYGLYALEMVQARAIVIIHELGHLANVIQLDDRSKLGRKKSVANSDCIRRNCIPCATTHTECPGMPKRHATAEGKRNPSAAYWMSAPTPARVQ